jgi:hypothetical protein
MATIYDARDELQHTAVFDADASIDPTVDQIDARTGPHVKAFDLVVAGGISPRQSPSTSDRPTSSATST